MSVGPLLSGETSLPVNRLRQKRRLRIRPTNPLEDPYVVAVSIAMAQARRQQTTLTGVIEHATTVKVVPSGQEIKKPGEVSRNLVFAPFLLTSRSAYGILSTACSISFCSQPEAYATCSGSWATGLVLGTGRLSNCEGWARVGSGGGLFRGNTNDGLSPSRRLA